MEAVLAALRPVDVAVDGLVTDRGSALFLFQPSGDLLRRPAGLQALDHVLTQVAVHGQLAAPLPASARQLLRVQGEVAAEAPVAVAEAVAAQLPETVEGWRPSLAAISPTGRGTPASRVKGNASAGIDNSMTEAS